MATVSNPIILKITNAGKLNALSPNSGKVQLSVDLTHIAIGSGRYTATGNEIGINALISKIDTVAGDIDVATNTLHFSATIYANKPTPVYELGLLDSAGGLFAIAASLNTPLFTIYPNVAFVVAFGISLNEATSGSVTVTISPNNSLMPAVMQNHLTAPNPHPQYLNNDHLDVSKDPHPQYVTLSRFQLLLDTAFPVGYLHHTHDAVNPKPQFDALLGIATAWRRLAGRIIVGIDPADPYIQDVGLTIGQKGMTSDAGINRPHVYPLHTTNIFERYNPDDAIETVWRVSADKTSIDEGAAIRFTVTANNVADGQILRWTVKEGALNDTSNDITAPDKNDTGTVILKNGTAVIDFVTSPDDNIAESQKYVRLTIGAPANLSINVPIIDAGRTETFIHITSSTNDGIVLDEYFKRHSSAYPVSTDKVRFIINPYVDVIAVNASTPALQAGANWPAGSQITVENKGRIIGRGGAGGATARFSWQRNHATNQVNPDQMMYDLTSPAKNGGNGGTAIEGNMTIENYGLIAGGGGGGGGGGIYYTINSQWGFTITINGVKQTVFIGGGGGSGGGAPLGKRRANLHTLEEFYENYNSTGTIILEPTDGNYITHLYMMADNTSNYNVAGKGASKGLYPLPNVRADSISDVAMFAAPRWVDKEKGFYYWQNDSAGVLQQSQNATIDNAGGYGYHPPTHHRYLSGMDAAEISVNTIKQNHGGSGGGIGENGSDGVMVNFYDMHGQVAPSNIIKKLLPAKGGLAGFVKEGDVVINNFAGGSTKGR